MNFVTFHVHCTLGMGEGHPNTNLVHQQYIQMIDMLFRSARLFCPEASCTLLTDNNTVVDNISGEYRRIKLPININTLMLSRSLAQLQYLESYDFTQPVVLLDSDILLNASISPLLQEDFDVGLTWRENKSMPINGGFLILNNRRPDITRAFFRQFVNIYRDRYIEKSNWYGDQLALRDCVGLSYQEMAISRIVTVDGCRILLLPCDTYNFSPKNSYNAIKQRFSDKIVIHFKGQRKRLMEPFWNSYLLSHESHTLSNWYKSYLSNRQILKLASRERDLSMKQIRGGK